MSGGSGILGQALGYARAGWPVFPTRPDADPCPAPGRCQCKAPLTAHGVCDATVDPDQIRAWWRRWPDANVAVATGAPGPDVLDVDVRPAGSGFGAFNRCKCAGLLTGATALIRTPSGLHVYFTGTAQPSARLPRQFLDLKAAGGYVVAPPSRAHGRSYELLDHRPGTGQVDWQAVRALLDPPRAAAARPANGDHDVTHLAAWVAGQPEGNRNAGLYWAACKVWGDPGAADQLVAAAVAAGLTEAEARRTVASATRRAER